ncbi:MAG: NTP transferase domain-containing protein, partial [Anaerolineaceae bacterium]|nr:NTP transferase domain-containing protein [Anaerolineaceae bacterium]
MTLASIILAAGEGTRMRSKYPKVLHKLAGKPLVWYALKAVEGLANLPPVLVVGHGAEAVKAAMGNQAVYALQSEQLGTGHAVLMAQPMLESKADTL